MDTSLLLPSLVSCCAAWLQPSEHPSRSDTAAACFPSVPPHCPPTSPTVRWPSPLSSQPHLTHCLLLMPVLNVQLDVRRRCRQVHPARGGLSCDRQWRHRGVHRRPLVSLAHKRC